MLQASVESLGALGHDMASWGAQWWQGTACAYPWVQNYIGWCPPQPWICQYVPTFMTDMCNVAVSAVSNNYSAALESLNTTTGMYATIALASAYMSWQLYQQMSAENKQLEKKVDTVALKQTATVQVMAQALQEISTQFLAIHKQLIDLNTKFDSLTPVQANTQIDAIKRARKQLQAYMKQAGVSDIFYGDKLREMGLEILAKNKEGEALHHSPLEVMKKEEKRLEQALAAREREQKERKAKKSPAFALHVEKDAKENSHSQLLAEIRAKPKLNPLPC